MVSAIRAACALASLILPSGTIATQSPPKAQHQQQSADLLGDALPPGAVARMGTVRFRHASWIRQVAFSPDGSTIASSNSQTIRFWNARDGQELHEIREPNRPVSKLAFSPDGETLAVLGGMELRLYGSKTGKVLHTLPGQRTVAFSPDGKLLAAGFSQEFGANFKPRLRLWEVATGKEFKKFDIDMEVTTFSPDGKLLVAGGGYTGNGPDKPLVLLDAATGAQFAKLEPPEGGDSTSVLFSPDGKLLLAVNSVTNKAGVRPWRDSSAILVWEVPGGRLMRRIAEGITGSHDAIAISPDGKSLAIGRWVAGQPGRNHYLSLWDLATAIQLWTAPGNESGHHSVAFSPDGKSLASAGADAVVRRWRVDTGEEIVAQDGHEGLVTSLCFSPDGKSLASGSHDHSIRLWDASTGRQRLKLPGHSGTAHVESVAYSPDGRFLASAAWYDRAVILWDAETGKEARRLEADGLHATAVAFSTNGALLASGGMDHCVRIWDLATGKEVHKLTGHRDGIRCVCFSPDGKTLASGGGGDNDVGQPEDLVTIRLWDVATGKEVRRFGTRDQGPVFALSFSADGKMLASSGGNAWKPDAPSVRIWDPATGVELRGLRADAEREHARALAFSPDGKALAVAHSDLSLRFWDPHTGKELHRIKDGHRGRIACLAFAPDGKRLATGSADTTVLVWDTANLVK